MLITTIYWLVGHIGPKPTPLQGFTAPFVFGNFKVPVDNPLTQESVQLGRRLFYDKQLSGDNSVSCSTCHLQHLAFTDGKARAVGVSGKTLDFSKWLLGLECNGGVADETKLWSDRKSDAELETITT